MLGTDLPRPPSRQSPFQHLLDPSHASQLSLTVFVKHSTRFSPLNAEFLSTLRRQAALYFLVNSAPGATVPILVVSIPDAFHMLPLTQSL